MIHRDLIPLMWKGPFVPQINTAVRDVELLYEVVLIHIWLDGF